MNLGGQARSRRREHGYAMAAMLVSIAIMSLLLSMAMPVWRHAAKRQKEAELIFRGEQYARAVGLFQRKFAGAFPPSLDVLVEQKFLRRKYTDPMTEDGEFQILYQALRPTTGAAGATQPGAGQPGTAPPRSASSTGAGGGRGGVIGVASKSKEESIRLYEGRSRYDQWQFVYTAVSMQPGAGPGTQQQRRPGAAGGAPGVSPSGGAPGQRSGMPGRGQLRRPTGSTSTPGSPAGRPPQQPRRPPPFDS